MSGVQALAATKALLQSLVHPDDFDAMWRMLARRLRPSTTSRD